MKRLGITQVQDNIINMHESFGHPVRDEIAMIDPKESDLACGLIKEETTELEDAIELGDIRGIVDALGDLEVVIRSAAVRYGVDLDILVNDYIHPSNMSKLCKDLHTAQLTKEKYADKGIATVIVPSKVEGMFVVKRESDGKFLKSIDYFEPDIDGFLRLHG